MSACKSGVSTHAWLGRSALLGNDRGMAMLTVMMVLLMLTVLGIAAITVSGLGNTMAGLQRTMEASANAAESNVPVNKVNRSRR